MLGQYANSTAAGKDNRFFIYEVSGLAPSDVSARSQWSSRSSASQFFQVPFHRMNEEMQRLTALGGKIINIWPLGSQAASATSPAAPASQPSGDSDEPLLSE